MKQQTRKKYKYTIDVVTNTKCETAQISRETIKKQHYKQTEAYKVLKTSRK